MTRAPFTHQCLAEASWKADDGVTIDGVVQALGLVRAELQLWLQRLRAAPGGGSDRHRCQMTMRCMGERQSNHSNARRASACTHLQRPSRPSRYCQATSTSMEADPMTSRIGGGRTVVLYLLV